MELPSNRQQGAALKKRKEKFKELGLEGEILKGIEDLGFEVPSPVQEKVIPVILGEENDLVALAQTGTGKTAAFGLPLLQKLDTSLNAIQVLILSPTRELCMQIGKDLQNYAKYRSDIRVHVYMGGRISANKSGNWIGVYTYWWLLRAVSVI